MITSRNLPAKPNYGRYTFEFNNFTNSLLQLEFKKAGITVSRFAVNTTFGVLGMFDTADKVGLKRQNEDFGQTLGFMVSCMDHLPNLVCDDNHSMMLTSDFLDFLCDNECPEKKR